MDDNQILHYEKEVESLRKENDKLKAQLAAERVQANIKEERYQRTLKDLMKAEERARSTSEQHINGDVLNMKVRSDFNEFLTPIFIMLS
jgi:hypothetical protein